MKIKYSKPIAGQLLNIEVRVGNHWASLIVLLDKEKLVHKQFDCPDPPCHELFSLPLSPESKGKLLRLEGNDPDGPQTIEAVVE